MTPRPHFIPSTGETELHLTGNLLDRHKHHLFYATQKMDGFSLSFGNHNGVFVASTRDRVVNLNERSVFGEAFRRGVVAPFQHEAIIQGELCGPGIRGNPHRLDTLCFFAFDLIACGKPAGWSALKSFCRLHQIETVPILFEDHLLLSGSPGALALYFAQVSKQTDGEGAVFRPMTETWDEFQGRVSFKVFNPHYAFHH